MMSKRAKTWFTILMVVITVLMVFPLLWMLMMSFKSNAEIMSDPLSWPKALNWDNYRNALKTLNYPRLYLNTFVVCVVSLIIELTITFFSSFALARMTYKRPGLTKPVIATVVIFNVLYIWNEYPYASVMLRNQADYTLSMGASFFKGTYTVDYGGIVASSVMIIIPELIFYGLFQKKIVGGMVAGAVKG